MAAETGQGYERKIVKALSKAPTLIHSVIMVAK